MDGIMMILPSNFNARYLISSYIWMNLSHYMHRALGLDDNDDQVDRVLE